MLNIKFQVDNQKYTNDRCVQENQKKCQLTLLGSKFNIKGYIVYRCE